MLLSLHLQQHMQLGLFSGHPTIIWYSCCTWPISLLQVMGLLPRFQAARKQAVEDSQEHPTDAPLVSDLPPPELCAGNVAPLMPLCS